MIDVREISDKLKYPQKIRGQLQNEHMNLLGWASEHYEHSLRFHKAFIHLLNVVSYCAIVGETLTNTGWKFDSALENVPNVSEHELMNTLGDLYISVKDVDWSGFTPLASEADCHNDSDNTEVAEVRIADSSLWKSDTFSDDGTYKTAEEYTNISKSKPEDLMFQPLVPRVDYKQVIHEKIVDGTKYVIYKSLPEIPVVQSDISVTTDISQMSDSDLLNLFPDVFFYTRPAEMYTSLDACIKHPKFGNLLRIDGFTEEELVDNIIRYPAIEGLYRLGMSKGAERYVDFWKFIEIDSTLYKLLDIWDEIDDLRDLPKSSVIASEYVIRRYLLERDVRKIKHKYSIYGDLQPFLTLFMPKDMYVEYGYADLVSVARSCVTSRVSYLQNRNPIIKKIKAAERDV